jgi:hypothetical protein
MKMSDQGAVIITMTVPESTGRGLFVSGAGTLSATLRGVGCLVEGTDAGETKAAVQISGTALASLAGTTTAGAHLCADAAGQLVVKSTEADDLVCAIALEGGSADELRRVKII